MLTARKSPWTNVVGFARTLLASSTAITLLFNHTSVLFRPVAGIPVWPGCDGLRRADAFCLASHHLEWARWLCIAGLLVVASGWRPRYTGVLHWWITFGIQASAATVDGGDQIASILTLMLIPVTLTDARRWHWDAPEVSPRWEAHKRITAMSALGMIRAQMALVYLHAAVGKAYASQWQDGTALYYWLTNRDFGAPSWLAHLLRPFLVNGLSVSLLTWGVIVLELSLAAGLILPVRRRATLLALGIALHLGILVVHGLVSFSLVMIAGLVLYLRPVDRRLQLHLPVLTHFTPRPRGSAEVFA